MPPLFSSLRFKHLRLIDVLARTQNLHKVAAELNITQPGATKMLREIEAMLGVSLFDRTKRPLAPSEIGQHVVDYARRTLTDGNRFASSVANLKRGGFGALAIGAIMATAPDLLPKAIAELKRRRPLMTIQVMAATSDRLTDALGRGELDVVLGRVPATIGRVDFDFEPLAVEELWAFVSDGHPLAHARTVRLSTLEHVPWTLQPAPSPMRHLIDALFAANGLRTLDNIVETSSVSIMLHLVRHAGMVAVLPSQIIAPEIERGDFVRLPIQIEGHLDPYGIVKRRGEVLAPNASEFVAVIRELSA